MTDREKMIEAINRVQAYGIMSNAFGGDLPVTNEMLADALIAAGIGDTTNLIVENEVLQRALLTTCVNLIKDEVDNVSAELLARVVYTKALRKAKKEVEEENNAKN